MLFKIEASLKAAFLGQRWYAQGPSGDPLWHMAAQNKPWDFGFRRWYPTEADPAHCPKTVTLWGSPPNKLMCLWTHWRDNCWSFRPLFPGITPSCVDKNPKQWVCSYVLVFTLRWYPKVPSDSWLWPKWRLHAWKSLVHTYRRNHRQSLHRVYKTWQEAI